MRSGSLDVPPLPDCCPGRACTSRRVRQHYSNHSFGSGASAAITYLTLAVPNQKRSSSAYFWLLFRKRGTYMQCRQHQDSGPALKSDTVKTCPLYTPPRFSHCAEDDVSPRYPTQEGREGLSRTAIAAAAARIKSHSPQSPFRPGDDRSVVLTNRIFSFRDDFHAACVS